MIIFQRSSFSVSSISTSPSTSGSSYSLCSSSSMLLMSTSISSIGASLLMPQPTRSSLYKGKVNSVGLSIRKPEFSSAMLYITSAYSMTSLSTSDSDGAALTLPSISLITGWWGLSSRVFLASMQDAAQSWLAKACALLIFSIQAEYPY